MPTRTTRSFRLPPRVLLALAVLAASLTMAVVLARPAQAASLTVTTQRDELNNDGDCSLREAIEAANTNAAVDGCAAGSDTEGDTILFAVGQKGTITLRSALGPLHITDGAGLTMTGKTKKITISGNDATQVFYVETGAVFDLDTLTVTNGKTKGASGAGCRERRRVSSRDEIIARAKTLGVKVADPLVLAQQRDPYYIGTDSQIEKAEWFARFYEEQGSRTRRPSQATSLPLTGPL